MFSNYIKIAFRNLIKFKSFSIINISGLAIGIASCVLIILFVADELSYDKFYKNSDRIYRIHTEVKIGDNENKMAVSPGILYDVMMDEIPEVETAVRLRGMGAPVFKYGEKVFSEENVIWVDSTFFNVFQCEFLEGSPDAALKSNDALVITESMRKKYFGNGSAVGNVITQDFSTDLKVTGVIRDFPTNSHFSVDFLENLASVPSEANINYSRWMASNYFTYVLLKKGTDLENFQNKLDGLVTKYAAPQIEAFTGQEFKSLSNQGSYFKLKYQPLTDIHLYSNLEYELSPNSDISYIYIFSIIAIAILVIACINFMNLSTARSTARAKEVGIRKTLGSNKAKLIAQFLTESIIISLFAVIAAMLIVNLSMSFFNNIAGKSLSLQLTDNYYAIPGLLIISIIVGIMAGLYPAFLLTSYTPSSVMKGMNQSKGKAFWLRNGLVVFQFSVSVILLIGTLVVSSQLNYMQNKNLGFEKDQLLVIERTDDLSNRFKAFKDELIRYPHISNISNHNTIPGRSFGNTVYKLDRDASQGNYQMMIWFADYDLIDTYKLKMAEGRYFSENYPTDSNAVVINETAAKMMGIQSPIGNRIVDMGVNPDEATKMEIIGIIKDFHFESMHTPVRPMIIIPERSSGSLTAVRIAGGNIQETIEFINKTWKKFTEGEDLNIVFLDDEFNRIYSAELKTGEIFTSFSVLAIVIACLGLFGLAAFITLQKTKEIGIRKVMGASIESILYLLVKEFTKWVIIANIVAWPVSYWMMNNWLNGFAYRVDINYSTFLISGAVSIIVALITVSMQVIRAASKNPVVSLKYE